MVGQSRQRDTIEFGVRSLTADVAACGYGLTIHIGWLDMQ